MRIAVERLQNGRGIERGRQAHGQRDAAGALHEIGEHVRRQRQALALCQCPDRAPRQNLRRRLDVERIVPRQRQPVRPLDIDIELRGAGAGRIQRQRHRAALLGGELCVGHGIAADLDRAGGFDADGVVAGCALDIVEIHAHGAVVAVEQEARQGRGQHHGIAHRDVGRGAAEFGRGPRHRHHPRGAGEFRNVKTDLGGAVGGNRDDAGIQRQAAFASAGCPATRRRRYRRRS